MKLTNKTLRRLIKEELEAVLSTGIPDIVELTHDILHDDDADDGDVYGHGGTARMARGQLYNIAKDAQSIHDRLNDNDELPEWVQSKIAMMYAGMSTVADHLGYKMHRHDVDPHDV